MPGIEVSNCLCEVTGNLDASKLSVMSDFLGDCPDSAFPSLHKSTDAVDDILCDCFAHLALHEGSFHAF